MNSQIHLCACGCGSPTNYDRKRKCWSKCIREHTNRVDHPFKGKHHTEETKEYFKKLYDGKHFSPETELKTGDILNPIGINRYTKTLSEDVNLKSQRHVPGLKQKE